VKRLTVMIAGAALLAVSFVASPVGARPAAAAGCVQIYRVYFDSPGSDYGSNTSLNAEWIQLKNRCATAKSVTGWKIRDIVGHTYRFGTYTLRAGTTVKVHTGRGTNTATNRYWGSSWYIWNNTGDKAWLRNAAGTTVDTCAFSGAGDSAYC
jgi:hypothetical protein